MKLSRVGVDLAKNVYQLHGVDRHGKAVWKRRLRRRQWLQALTDVAEPDCEIGMEACTGAHHWARELQARGYTVRLIAPQFVKPFVKSNKNDANDAEAVCEAMSRPNMRFVAIKTVEQQDIQGLHRVRSRLVGQRTALINQARGLLMEYGVVVPQTPAVLRRRLPEIVDDAENGLTATARALFASLYQELCQLDERVREMEQRVQHVYKTLESCQRLAEVPGIGPLTATALVAAVGDARAFRRGREMAAWLGLVPRQHSTGGRPRLLGISKRGDRYLRTLLIHGARAVIRVAHRHPDGRNRWVQAVEHRRGKNVAAVALANKNARIAWALLATEKQYRLAA